MIYVFTLGYNLVSEITKTTKLLYMQNNRNDFHHIIVDLGFPMVEQGNIPDDFGVAKFNNTLSLMQLAQMSGSEYLSLPNIGVSQNWTRVCKHINPKDDDVIIGADPDERPCQDGWVRAMADVLTFGRIGLCSLINLEQVPVLPRLNPKFAKANGHNVSFFPDGTCAWALIGISGKFFKALGSEIPVPFEGNRYGWIESATYPKFSKLGFAWCMMSDYFSLHTLWEGQSIYQDWKVYVIKNREGGQISFEDYLTMRKEGKL